MTGHLDFMSYCVLDLTEGMRGSVQSVTDMQAGSQEENVQTHKCSRRQSFHFLCHPVQGHSHTSASSFPTSSCTLGLESGHLSLNTHC